MKTAIETLIEHLITQKSILKNAFEAGKWNDDRCSEIDNCIDLAKQLLEKEKQQLVSSYSNGQYNALNFVNGEQYFNQTFKKD
jgi:pyridoxal/pyridoxine/pyridoxamine kinase